MNTNTLLKVVSLAAILVVLGLLGFIVKVYFLEKISLDPEPPAPPPPPDRGEPLPPRPQVQVRDLMRAADRCAARMNIMGVVAGVLDLRTNANAATRVRNAMQRTEQSLMHYQGMIQQAGAEPPLAAYLRHSDRITRFRNFNLADFERADAESFLTDFLRHLHAGSKARLEVARGPERATVEIVIRDVPDDWPELVAPALDADAPAAEGPPPPPPPIPRTLTPEQVDALAVLIDPARRAKGEDRMLAIYELRRLADASGTAGGFYAAARLVLESRAELDRRTLVEYFQAHRIANVENMTPKQHLDAAAFLAERGARESAALSLLAIGHMGDAVRRLGRIDADVSRAAKTLGLEAMDGPVAYGRPADAAALSVAYWLRENKPDRALACLAARKGALDDPKVRFVQLYAELVAALPKARADLKGLHRRTMAARGACARSEDVASFDMLAGAMRAAGECGTCKGKGSEGVHACAVCRGSGWRDVPAHRSIDALLTRALCSRCLGRMTIIPGAAWRCDLCDGLGQTLSVK